MLNSRLLLLGEAVARHSEPRRGLKSGNAHIHIHTHKNTHTLTHSHNTQQTWVTPGEDLGLRVVMPGLRTRVQRDEHSGAWRPNSVGKEGKSPAVKERSLQTPQGCRTSHNSLPYPKVRSRGRDILERPGLLSSAPHVPLPTWTQLLGVSNATTPTFLRGAAHLDVGFAPRSHTPAPQSMVTLDARSPTLPGPPRAARSSPHFPKEVRSNTARPPAARALTGLRRKAGGGRREAQAGAAAAAGGLARVEATLHRAVLFPKYARSGHPANS